MVTAIVVVIMLFVCIAALIFGLTTSTRQQRITQRIEELQSARPVSEMSQSVVSRQLQMPFYDRVLKPVVKSANRVLLSVAPQGMIETVRKNLNAAGNPPGMSEPLFLLLRSAGMLFGVGIGVFFYTRVLADAQPMMRMLIPLLLLFMASMMPDYLLGSRIKTRQTAIRKALPDTLDLLVVSAEAGMGLDGALAEVVLRKEGPLVDEFERALLEIRLGKRRREAWQDMADRAQVEELTALVAALYQAEELGVSIAKALRAHSDALRSKRSMKIREQAAVLGTKLLFPLIFCIFPALFVIIMGPGILSMKDVFGAMGK
ncbi:type II secretion system F family protein [bacterium]|nr:type II secretion system F family protein [bacterium]